MFSTIEEALEAYKLELKRYVARSNELKSKHEDVPYFMWPEGDFMEVERSNSRIKGMVAALGLTAEEEARIDAECGVVKESAKAA